MWCLLAFGWAGLALGAWNSRDNDRSIVADLGTKLSFGARIVLEGEDGFAERAERWQVWKSPDVAAVVDVQTEEDVQETVCRNLISIFISFDFSEP